MGFFIPDQELAKAIEPGITGFRYPTAGVISGNSFLGLALHALGNDARQILSRQHAVMGPFVDLTFIRIQSLESGVLPISHKASGRAASSRFRRPSITLLIS